MGASAKVTTNAPAIPDTRVMMFPLLEMKERGERHNGGSAQNLQRSTMLPPRICPSYMRDCLEAGQEGLGGTDGGYLGFDALARRCANPHTGAASARHAGGYVLS